ncbi:MAG: hypothetical protein WCP67_09740 [Verrucomicrobiota bacterium]
MKYLLPAFLIALSTITPRLEALEAGTAVVDVTDRTIPVHDTLHAKALVLKEGDRTVVLLTIDAVALGEIGRIKSDFLPQLRARIAKELGLAPENLLVNASHCHGVLRPDFPELCFQVIKSAMAELVPVRAGVGSAQENSISENRRIHMRDGSEVDMRRAYSLPTDQAIAKVGAIDPQIGLLRLDRLDGRNLALIFNFACHPIMNQPGTGNSADYPGIASTIIEEQLGGTAFFIQGCAGDINPVHYKEVSQPADSTPLGNQLAVSVLRAARKLTTQPDSPLRFVHQNMLLPRGADLTARITKLEAERLRLVQSLRATNINFKSFLPLLLQQKLNPEYPSQSAQSYLHERYVGKDSLAKLDAENRAAVETYLANLAIMEQITRLNTNLGLLKMHLAQNEKAKEQPIDVELTALRVGDFRLVTFPGELTSEIGMNIKKAAGQPGTFVAGYTNGYIYYAPTAKQRLNTGYAQEDCDCLVAPEWQKAFESQALDMLKGL